MPKRRLRRNIDPVTAIVGGSIAGVSSAITARVLKRHKNPLTKRRRVLNELYDLIIAEDPKYSPPSKFWEEDRQALWNYLSKRTLKQLQKSLSRQRAIAAVTPEEIARYADIRGLPQVKNPLSRPELRKEIRYLEKKFHRAKKMSDKGQIDKALAMLYEILGSFDTMKRHSAFPEFAQEFYALERPVYLLIYELREQ